MRALAVDVFDVDGRADQMGRPRYINERFPMLRALEHGRKGCGGRRKPSSDPLGRPARDAAQSSGVISRGECVRNRVPVLAAAGIVAQLCACVELRAGEDENFAHRRCKRAARSLIVFFFELLFRSIRLLRQVFSPAGLLSRLKLAQRELKASRPLSSFFAGDLLELRLVLF